MPSDRRGRVLELQAIFVGLVRLEIALASSTVHARKPHVQWTEKVLTLLTYGIYSVI